MKITSQNAFDFVTFSVIIVYQRNNAYHQENSLWQDCYHRAGSLFFHGTLLPYSTYPGIPGTARYLDGCSQEPLDLITGFARKKLVQAEGFKNKIQSTTNRREALPRGLRFRDHPVGGSKATWPDRELPRKYGVNQAVGDTPPGVGGVFYGARHVPVIMDICRDMEELCPMPGC